MIREHRRYNHLSLDGSYVKIHFDITCVQVRLGRVGLGRLDLLTFSYILTQFT